MPVPAFVSTFTPSRAMDSNRQQRNRPRATCPPRRPARARPSHPTASSSSSSSHPPPKVGDELDGTVTRLASYGAFVDIGGGRSGLVHISEVHKGYVDDINALLKVGQTVHVRVIRLEKDSNRISLSIRASLRAQSTGYERLVELGGDWGHPWADDDPDAPEDQKTRFMKLSPRPMPSPHHWEPNPELFREWNDPPPPVWDDKDYNPIEGRPSV